MVFSLLFGRASRNFKKSAQRGTFFQQKLALFMPIFEADFRSNILPCNLTLNLQQRELLVLY